MKIKIKKLDQKAVIPHYSKPGDAGLDLTAISIKHVGDYIEYNTGLSFEIPEGHVGLIYPRSSNSNQDLIMSNSVGVVDSGYRGPIKIRFKRILNPTDHDTSTDLAIITASSFSKYYEVGDRIAQMIIMPYPKVEFEEVEELVETERGLGGFGSTNNK